ncbi:MAG: ATP-binding protein [Candidatus Eremiobacterota bacterium]
MRSCSRLALGLGWLAALAAIAARLPADSLWLLPVAAGLGLWLVLPPGRRHRPAPVPILKPSTEGVLRSLSNLLIVVSPEGSIRAVNAAACKALGYGHDELVGQPLERVVVGTPDPLMLASGGRTVEAAYRSRTGFTLPVLVSSSVLPGQEGSVQAVVLMAQDISQHKQYAAQLRLLVDRLLHAQEEERRKVAHDLHDGMLQYVIAAQMQLQGVQKGLREPVPGLDRGIEHLRAAVEEGRRLIYNLRPSSLDQFGLVETLRRELEESDLEVEFVVDLGQATIPSTMETGLYRIVQEALSNVRKHSGASGVEVRLGRVAQEIQLKVQDRGCGFDPEKSSEGVGLNGMRQRAELLGGWLEVSSAPGKGTVVRAGLPLSPTPPDPSGPPSEPPASDRTPAAC